MRIIGGKFSGRKINVSRSFDSRPTTDFAKEALFNILNNHFDFESVKVLDLFSGTGSLSFEFASRGCPEIDLVDKNARAISFISKTAAELGLKGIHPVRMDAFRFIPVCRKMYDIIVADPPYELRNIELIAPLVFEHRLLAENGWLIIEHGKSSNFKDFKFFREERNYGSVHFSFFHQ